MGVQWVTTTTTSSMSSTGTTGSFQQLYNIHFHWHCLRFLAWAFMQQTHSHRHLVHYIHRTGRPALLCDWTGHGFGLAFLVTIPNVLVRHPVCFWSLSGCHSSVPASVLRFLSSAADVLWYPPYRSTPASWDHSHHSPLHRHYEATPSVLGLCYGPPFWWLGTTINSVAARRPLRLKLSPGAEAASCSFCFFRQQHSCSNSQRLTPTGSLRAA